MEWELVGFCVWLAWCQWVCGAGRSWARRSRENSGSRGGGRLPALKGWEGRFNISCCDSYKRSLSAFSVFLRRKPRPVVWLSKHPCVFTHACFHAPSQAHLEFSWGQAPPAPTPVTEDSIIAHGHSNLGLWSQTQI